MNSIRKEFAAYLAEQDYCFHTTSTRKLIDKFDEITKDGVSNFIDHLIDIRVIDCASHEDIMQRWTDFQNS